MSTRHQTAQSRRLFLRRLGALSAITASGSLLAACSKGTSVGLGATSPVTTPANRPTGSLTSGHVEGRVLVLVDMAGGNDGLSMVVPAASSAYYESRPNLAIAEGDVLALNDRIGLNPQLTRLHKRGVTVVEGVGARNHDLSHFEMSERWSRGDVDGTARPATGFGGRISDALHQGAPATGVSMAGPAPMLLSQDAPALSFAGMDDLWLLKPSDWGVREAFADSLRAFGDDPVGQSYDQLLDLGLALGADEEDGDDIDWEHDMLSQGGDLGQQLWMAGDLINANVGTRVIYVQQGGFDTHEDHQWQHEALMSELDAAVGGFLDRADDFGFGDQVVVATVSEFGRRVRENDGGLDHGSASTMLVTGAIDSQVLGEPPSLDDLDEDGNLAVTTTFDRYLGSLAQEWMGVNADSVLSSNPEMLGLV